MMEVIDQVMDNYGYDYVIGKNISKKYYTNNLENINVFNECDSILEKAELISLGYYLFKRLGLEDVELSINKNDELCNLLDILDIEYLSNIDSDKLKWNYIYDDEIIGTGSLNSFKVDIKKLLSVLMNNINKDALNRVIDVNIIGNSEEESYHALKIAQDLRLNNINTLINGEYNSKFNTAGLTALLLAVNMWGLFTRTLTLNLVLTLALGAAAWMLLRKPRTEIGRAHV